MCPGAPSPDATRTASSPPGRSRGFDVHHLAVDGDVVLADWTITVERRSDRAPVAWRGMSTCLLAADGRIVWWREYYEDPATLRAARTS